MRLGRICVLMSSIFEIRNIFLGNIEETYLSDADIYKI